MGIGIIQKEVDKAIEQLRQRFKKLDAVDVVDRVLEDVIPEEISGDARFKLKGLIKKRLREDGAIK